jgi:hypothetical protein
MTHRGLLLVGSCCWWAACYNYLPLATPSPEPDTFVAVTLTDAGSEELADALGPGVAVVRGRLLTATEGDLSLSVAGVETHRGDVLAWRGENVLLPRAFVAAVGERRVSATRTALLAGASVLGLVVTYQAVGSSGGGQGSGGGSPAPR